MNPSAYKLEDWIDHQVWAFIPVLSPDCTRVTIRSVEAGGVWLETTHLPLSFSRGKDGFDSDGKIVVFMPYSQIIYIATPDLKGAARPELRNFN